METVHGDRLKVLHITPWYPRASDPFEGLWIQRHIASVAPYVDQYVIHNDIRFGPRPGIRQMSIPEGERISIRIPGRWWILIEVISFLVLFHILVIRRRARRFDVIQFHIAYPSLAFWHWLKPWVRKPVLITEHWSAYHFDFGVDRPEKLRRIRRIFTHGIPVVTVSKALSNDIKRFSKVDDLVTSVLPNVVPSDVFYYADQHIARPLEFLMAGQWKWPKQPQVLLEAFAAWVRHQSRPYTLKICGYSEASTMEINALVEKHGLQESVRLLGQLDAADLAREMQTSVAFLHCSAYETFSVVCAEALSCGTPVIASAVGGLLEMIDADNGILVPWNTVEAWCRAFDQYVAGQFDRQAIAKRACEKFSGEVVGSQYLNILQRVAREAFR